MKDDYSTKLTDLEATARMFYAVLCATPQTSETQEYVSDFANKITTMFGKRIEAVVEETSEAEAEETSEEQAEAEETSEEQAETEQAEETSEDQPQADKKKVKKPRKVVPDELRCEGRIWGVKCDGSERCSKAAKINGLCGQHAKMATECRTPCTMNESRTKLIGLVHGRITDYQVGEPDMPPYKDNDNYVVLQWSGGEVGERIKKGIREGTCLVRPTHKCARARWASDPA